MSAGWPRAALLTVLSLLGGIAVALGWLGGFLHPFDVRPMSKGDADAMADQAPPPRDAAPVRDLDPFPAAATAPGAFPAASPPFDLPVAPPVHAPLPIVPVAGVTRDELYDSFGDPRGDGTRRHEGIDIMTDAGTPVLAVSDGMISDIFHSETGGLTLTLRGKDAAYFYGHLSAYAPDLAEGEKVRLGDVLGRVGSTGNADPEAPHLHFEMRLMSDGQRWSEGRIVNPYDYLAANAYRPM